MCKFSFWISLDISLFGKNVRCHCCLKLAEREFVCHLVICEPHQHFGVSPGTIILGVCVCVRAVCVDTKAVYGYVVTPKYALMIQLFTVTSLNMSVHIPTI